MNFSYDTALMCMLGWFLHWTAGWGVEWKINKLSLMDYLLLSPPTFFFSLFSTLALYLIGPDLIAMLGVALPGGSQQSLKLALALMVGFAADSLFNKLADLFKRV